MPIVDRQGNLHDQSGLFISKPLTNSAYELGKRTVRLSGSITDMVDDPDECDNETSPIDVPLDAQEFGNILRVSCTMDEDDIRYFASTCRSVIAQTQRLVEGKVVIVVPSPPRDPVMRKARRDGELVFGYLDIESHTAKAEKRLNDRMTIVVHPKVVTQAWTGNYCAKPMPGFAHSSLQEWIVTHELGHTHEIRRHPEWTDIHGGVSDEAWAFADTALRFCYDDCVSTYAATDGPWEMYAEAFAQYILGEGGESCLAKRYSTLLGWENCRDT